MRLLLQYLCACITTINAFSAVQRRSLIPMSLRKKLCEMKADETMCDFEKDLYKLIDEMSYSKWAICKHHPELLLCKWDPSIVGVIPETQPKPETTTSISLSMEESLSEESEEFAVDVPNTTPSIIESSKFIGNGGAVEPEDVEVEEPGPLKPSAVKQEVPVNKEPPRFEEKLTDERELDVQTQRPEESQEEENFGENILEVKDDVFGGM
ncbi:hypothetical protein RB195_013520 [Necator americanus]|uniref:Uncharacterized protein n=1 Tax=Necator americanus TaxID=51031 RepID=A0ABR1DX33_NECAM